MKHKTVPFILAFLVLLTMACLSPNLVEKVQSLIPGDTSTPTLTKTLRPSRTLEPSSTSTPVPTSTPTKAPSPTVFLPDIIGSVTSAQDTAGNRSFVLCKIEGTSCVLTGLTTVSNESGIFEFDDVPVGQYYIFYDSGHEDFNEGVKKWEGKTIFVGDVQWLTDNFITKNEKGEISFTLIAGMAFDNNIAYMAVYRFFATSPFLWAHGCGTQNCATPEDVVPVVANVTGSQVSEVTFEVYGPFTPVEDSGETSPTAGVESPEAEVLYQDDFSDPASGWEVSIDKISERIYQNGEYVLRVGPKVSTSGVTNYSESYEDWAFLTWSPAGLSDLKNVAVDFDARSMGETTEGGYGIIFYFQDRDHYYFYEIYPGGQWALVKRGPQGANDIVTWTESDAIYTGTKSNHIRLELRENEITLYINGQLVSNQSISYQPGDVGFYADTWNESNLTFEAGFDNFTVAKLP